MPVRGGHNKAAETRMSRGEAAEPGGNPYPCPSMPTNRRALF